MTPARPALTRPDGDSRGGPTAEEEREEVPARGGPAGQQRPGRGGGGGSGTTREPQHGGAD